jgi:bifunctional polynucleotide phosphatase/kinase
MEIESILRPSSPGSPTNCWKFTESVMIYKSPDFVFHSDIIITEFDDCLIKPLSQKKIYSTMNEYNVDIFDPDFMHKLTRESANKKAIIVLSNQASHNKLLIDMIKLRVENFVTLIKFPILCFFSLKPNRFMKPHTGMWSLLNAYYAKVKVKIAEKLIVSNEGGAIINKLRRNGEIDSRIKYSDTDRAFAHNIQVEFKLIEEFVEDKKPLVYKWNTNIIAPEKRLMYCDVINDYKNPSVFRELALFGKNDVYIIIVMGAPRSGKTRFSEFLVKQWRKSSFGQKNEVVRLGMDEYTKKRRYTQFRKSIEDRLSVVLDGGCHLENDRQYFVNYAEEKNIPILYVEINNGLEMAKLFNHVCVEEAKSENTVLYSDREFHIYRSLYRPPKVTKNTKYVLICPKVEYKPHIMKFRY